MLLAWEPKRIGSIIVMMLALLGRRGDEGLPKKPMVFESWSNGCRSRLRKDHDGFGCLVREVVQCHISAHFCSTTDVNTNAFRWDRSAAGQYKGANQVPRPT
jgi:hypothetical protein